MELAFETRALRTLCEEDDVAAKKLPGEVVDALKRRLADLHAADSVLDLVVGRPDFDPTAPLVRMTLAANYVLTCAANHRICPLQATGAVDWQRVRRLKILTIERSESDA
ncbi:MULTISPECIES: hypothetical protein [Kribbella]|nr:MULTISPECIES: hypothetical protein [Kribbella]